jgi:hypothetical protein
MYLLHVQTYDYHSNNRVQNLAVDTTTLLDFEAVRLQ